jgi:eukaryotic-like serine/threonine-protein kinase
MLDDLQPGDPQLIGPYRLREVLGTGGMGRVFLGASAQGRLVAVKVVHAGLAADPAFRARFRREVEVARKVSGPFTAPLVDADVDGPVPWLATAYVAGPSLADVVAEGGPMPPGAVLELAAGLADGLSAIHAAGVVHRDLKPSNILLARDGPRLIDFGISGASGATALTGTDLMIGSPGYMSPEQAEGSSVGPASDIFSLGAVLAFAVTGEGPFGPGSTVALIYRVIRRPADLTRVPGEVRGLIERCLVKDPALRPAACDLQTATRTARSLTARPAEPVTGRFIPRPALAAVAQAVTAPLPVRVPLGELLTAPDLPLSMTAPGPAARRPSPDRPTPRESRFSWQRLWRPLTVATLIAALAGAAVMAGLALASARPQAAAVQSERPAAAVRVPSPAAATPSSANRHTSRSAAAARKASSAESSSSPPASVGTSAERSGPSASPRPSGSASPTSRPYPPVSPSPSASPSLASGGYGY